MHHADGSTSIVKKLVEPSREVLGTLVERLLQCAPSVSQMLKNRMCCSHRKRMHLKSAGEECGIRRGIGTVAVLPNATVDTVHVESPARDGSNRHPPAKDLAVRGQIGCDAKMRLCPTGMDTEPRDHFIEDQRHTVVLSEASQLLQKLLRLQLRVSALHGLDQYGAQFVATMTQDFQ